MRAKQWYLQIAGWRTMTLHFFETVSMPRSSGTVKYSSTCTATCGGKCPRMSKVDLAYCSKRRIWLEMSPGRHAGDQGQQGNLLGRARGRTVENEADPSEKRSRSGLRKFRGQVVDSQARPVRQLERANGSADLGFVEDASAVAPQRARNVHGLVVLLALRGR